MYSITYLCNFDIRRTVCSDKWWRFWKFTIVLAFGFGAIAVLQFFNFYHEKAIWEFVLGLVFFVIVTLLLKNNVEIQTIESLAQIYGVDVSALFKLLFGFVFM